MKSIRRILVWGALLLFAWQPVSAQSDAPLTLVMTIDGPIAPAMQQYLHRAIQVAEQRQAEILVLQLNTPGGSIDTMNNMIQEMRASRVPIVVYVAPRGAMAGSAGTIITLAGHAAAMAPETAIGAASPVGPEGEDLGKTLQAKVAEITKATIRSLAERRGPEAVKLAEETIDKARAVSANEALEAGLIDFVANDLDDLLRQLDGFQVELADGPRTLHTANARVDDLPLTFIEQLLKMLTDPNIVFLLLTIGVQAVFIELSQPGGWVSGFIGIVCLALATYGLGILPVNWFGLLFMAISFVLFVLDVKAPTHGALTAAGIGSFIVGALVLFNSPGTPQFERVSVPLVIMVGILTGLMFAAILSFALRALRAPVRTGRTSLIGNTGTAQSALDPSGTVRAGSELWSAELAEGAEAIQKGERIEVVAVEGLRLKVRKLDEGTTRGLPPDEETAAPPQ
ncbi:MAG: nodulation protein NfeD [Chloroflexi bacterium]|nr:nodulation protein NfeD [Chloroflexota bacterium]